MGLFKSAEERRIEREIKIRQGIRRIEKSVAEQNKFTDEFIRNARFRLATGKKTTVLLEGPELSKARGGPRCLSMPLLRGE